MDSLLDELQRLDVGRYWNSVYVGAVCYADDLTLLALLPSALRLMSKCCEDVTTSHGLMFNSSNIQLLRFGRLRSSICSAQVYFQGSLLHFVDSATHLGHLFQYDLGDNGDIAIKSRNMVRTDNCILSTFSGCDPRTLTKLFQSHCLSLYIMVLLSGLSLIVHYSHWRTPLITFSGRSGSSHAVATQELSTKPPSSRPSLFNVILYS